MIFNLADAGIVIAELKAEDEWKQKQIVSQRKRIAELEQEIEELKEVAAIIDHQRAMERVILRKEIDNG